jgi:KaiC/GvpD/RAD55 family RecA-like ATPase
MLMTQPKELVIREPGDESEQRALRHRLRGLRLWDLDRHDTAPHEEVEASDQIVDAMIDVERDPACYLHWPWPTLDKLVGGMAPNEVHYVCAFSSSGKTTFLTSAVNRWIDDGQRVFVLPLETQPKKFRTQLACLRLGIHPGDAFSGELRRRNDPLVDKLTSELRTQIHAATNDCLRVKSAPEITAAGFGDACEEAADWGATVVIVDHVDHIAAGDGSSLYVESVQVNRTALRCAQRLGLTIVLASQLNNDAVRGDHLARYQPPRESFVQMGGHKRQVASGMIGLYRPLRARRPEEDPKRYGQLLALAKSGAIPPHDFLLPNTMGVVLMKSRSYGTREWQRVNLRVEQGRVIDPGEKSDAQ